MPADYSRTSFDPDKHFSAVLMQQGRVLFDADLNEQGDISTHFLRSLAADLIGPHGGAGTGFDIQPAVDLTGAGRRDFEIAAGRYYVGGVLAETGPTPVRFTSQPSYDPSTDALQPGTSHVAYLDVWEQEVTAVEDESIGELGLTGVDTAARRRVAWQVRTVVADRSTGFEPDRPEDAIAARRPALSTAQLTARAEPTAGYHDVENHLYRVQIHRGGDAASASFIWSRSNASTSWAVTGIGPVGVEVAGPNADARGWPQQGDWVEVVDDVVDAQGRAPDLVCVRGVDADSGRVDLGDPGPTIDVARRPILRRWDHGRDPSIALREGAIPVVEGSWLDLEQGVQVSFAPGNLHYLAGDYWEIPARTGTSDVVWPRDCDGPQPRPPRGVEHYTAPLALISVAESAVTVERSYRRTIEPWSRPRP